MQISLDDNKIDPGDRIRILDWASLHCRTIKTIYITGKTIREDGKDDRFIPERIEIVLSEPEET